jgi:uncharacterized protein
MKDNGIILKIKSIEAEIRAFGVDKLYLFGSALREDFNNDSDVDLIVDFLPGLKTPDNYFGLYQKLGNLLNRKIDLITRLALESKMENRVYSTMKQVV